MAHSPPLRGRFDLPWPLHLLGFFAVSACLDSPLDDLDGDGWLADQDCADRDPTIHPGAPERCDDVDQDCDGAVDEEATDLRTWWLDADGDGYGRRSDAITACARPSGYAAQDGDCQDGDGDVFPGAPEVCDGRDQDCDGAIDNGITERAWYLDIDGDGSGAGRAVAHGCDGPPGTVPTNDDCNDVAYAVSPWALERCNAVDDDCDGRVDDDDDDVWDAVIGYTDRDGDGDGDPATARVTCALDPWEVMSFTDCDDDNPRVSQGTTWFLDVDADGFGDDAHPFPARQCARPPGHAPVGGDCAPYDPARHPLAAWFVDQDGDGAGGAPGSGCAPATGWATTGGDCDDTSAARAPGTPERCDGVDQDCDGSIDEPSASLIGGTPHFQDVDGDGWGDGPARSQCGASPGWATRSGDCDDDDPEAFPGAAWWLDADRDGFGDLSRPWPVDTCGRPPNTAGNDEDCDDTDPGQHPGVTWYADDDGDGVGGAWAAEGCHDDAPVTRRRGDCDDADPEESTPLALHDVPGTMTFEWCWASCGVGSWDVAADGTFSATGLRGSWSYDCPTGTITILYSSGTVYTGVTHDGVTFSGTMRSYTGAEGTWTGTLGASPPA